MHLGATHLCQDELFRTVQLAAIGKTRWPRLLSQAIADRANLAPTHLEEVDGAVSSVGYYTVSQPAQCLPPWAEAEDERSRGCLHQLCDTSTSRLAVMPISQRNLSIERVDFEKSLSTAELEVLVANPRLKILQTSSPVEPATWDMLDDMLFSRRPDIELRVYGFYSSACDLSFLRRMRKVRRFAANCLMKAKGLEYLVCLENIESLSVGIYSLESFDFLEDLPIGRLRTLSLEATKSRRPSLHPLARFDRLRKLYIEGQHKDIEVIANLCCLEDLTLRSISIDGLDFLRGLNHLWSLDIKLGGIRDLSALNGMGGIKYFELWMVKGLQDVSVISTMLGLQFLFLQSLRNISSVPDLSKLTAL